VYPDAEVDVAVLQVELALPEIGIRIPSADVVVDGHAWIPLRDLVQRAVTPHPVGAVLRHAEGVVHRDRGLAPLGRDRLIEVDPAHRVVYADGGGPAVHLDIAQVIAPLEATHAPARVGWEECRALAPGSIEILVELQPDEAQAVGGVVGITDRHGTTHALLGRVESDGDDVVRALLPVGRTRRATR
jgi:hypothetical protein